MYSYQINFSKYKLRNYERCLAVKEFESQFPSIKDKSITNKGISFTTHKILDEFKLKKLTFYSEFYFQNAEIKKPSILTDQVILENYQKPILFPCLSREIRYLTHSFHEYKGRFYPQLAKAFMNYAGLKNGDIVLDPFCGSGTTLVESLLFGVNAIGIDINPLAYILTKAKIKSLFLKHENLTFIKEIFDNIQNNFEWIDIKLENYNNNLDIEYLKKWFPENNLKKIILVQNIIQQLPDEAHQLFAKVILSDLLKEFSFQEPKQLRVRRRSDIPHQNLLETFKKNLSNQIENLKNFQSLNLFVLNSKIENYLGDVRTLMNDTNLQENSIDAVITSPPYGTALPYMDTDRLSLFAFGLTDRKTFREIEETLIGNREITKPQRLQLDKELEMNFKKSILPNNIIELLKKIYLLNKNSNVGFRRKNTAALLYKYFLDMNTGMNQISKVLKKNKLAFFVVGNNRTIAGGEKIDIPTNDFISCIAQANGFKLIEKINMNVQKGYMIHSKNAINTESILVLQCK